MVLSLKNSLKTTFSKEKVLLVLEYAKRQIIEQAKNCLVGSEKKSNVDKAVVMFIKSNFVSSNPLISLGINILIDNVPLITQCVYDSLKKYVDGLTEV